MAAFGDGFSDVSMEDLMGQVEKRQISTIVFIIGTIFSLFYLKFLLLFLIDVCS